MSGDESLGVGEAAQALHRSERSVRRYLQEGRLEYDKQPTVAGFRYAITAASVDALARELQPGQVRGSSADLIALAGEVQALRAVIEELRAEVAALPKALPPAPEQKRRPWWQRLTGRRSRE